jgi:hypothetical protein
MAMGISGKTGDCSELIEIYRKELEQLSAWRGNISQDEAEVLLKGRRPYTFLFRYDDEREQFVISHTQSDSSVDHKVFCFDEKRMQWRYDNEYTHYEEKASSLIPQMRHCDPSICESI